MDKYPNFYIIDVSLGGTYNRNHLIKKSELPDYARRWKEQNKISYVDCYKTYWLYPNAMLEHFEKHKSVSGYDGPVYAEFLPLDIDSNDLIRSIQTTKEILIHLEREFQVDLKLIRGYFSGAKGFHLELPSGLFGFEPSQFLNKIFKDIAFRLLPKGITIDSAVYDKVRLWRLQNTINSKSGLHKIQLSVDELFNLTIPESKDLAKNQRKGAFFDTNVTLNPSLNRLYVEVKEEVLKRTSEPKNTGERIYKEFLQEGAKEGERNNVLTSYAGKLRALGIPEEEAKVILKSLNQTQCIPPLEEKEVNNILKSVFRYETGAKHFEFRTTPWHELIGKEEPEIEFLIEDLLPRACLLILAGKPKLGKSLLALLLAFSVALGKSLWDKKVKQGGVLFISTEDGAIRLKKRIWKMIGDPNKHAPDCHFYVGDCILTQKDIFEALKAKVIELKPKLIVLDPLVNLFRGHKLDSAEDMNAVLRPLQNLAKETGPCVLVIHHARKSSGEGSIDIVQGSITISGVADGLLLLRSFKIEGEEKRATLEVILKDAEVSHKAVLKLGNMLKWEVEGKFEDIMNQSLETEVIEALQNDPDGLTINNLMSILSVEYKPLYRLLLTLEKENKVNVSRVGKYHTKVYSLENEWKTKMENEKSDASNGNDSENAVMEASFSKTPKSEKRNEQVENEAPKSSFSKNDLPEKMENEHHSDTCDCDQCCPFKDIPEVIS